MRKLIKRYYPGGLLPNTTILDMVLKVSPDDFPILRINPNMLNVYFAGLDFLFYPSDSSKFQLLFNTNNIKSTGNIAGIAGSAFDTLGAAIPKKELSALTTGLNSAYDTIANTAMKFGPWGAIIGGAMKLGGLASDGLTAAGVGTDLLTTADKILDSKFLKLTPTGLINALGAKKSDKILKDNEAFELIGSSYTGTSDQVDQALTKSDKKYGLLSRGAMKKANKEIGIADIQQNKVSDISDTTKLARLRSSNMANINNRRYSLALQGGYNAANIRVGKSGLKFPSDDLIKRAKAIYKNKKVVESNASSPASKITFEAWYKTIPEDRNDTTSYNLKRAFELAPFEELERWRTSSVEDLKNGRNHLNSVYYNDSTGYYEFMKSKNHPTLKFELEWYNSDKAKEFRDLFDLDTSEEYYKYIPKGSKKFAEGGKMNVIPDGALHARLHHMDVDGITKKGIPVITKEEGGEIVQHAEIERDEIIFTKEVTEKLEELYKEGTDEAAIEAGKILAREIVENTIDNTGLILTVQ